MDTCVLSSDHHTIPYAHTEIYTTKYNLKTPTFLDFQIRTSLLKASGLLIGSTEQFMEH